LVNAVSERQYSKNQRQVSPIKKYGTGMHHLQRLILGFLAGEENKSKIFPLPQRSLF
jgi:hypothetical protein